MVDVVKEVLVRQLGLQRQHQGFNNDLLMIEGTGQVPVTFMSQFLQLSLHSSQQRLSTFLQCLCQQASLLTRGRCLG